MLISPGIQTTPPHKGKGEVSTRRGAHHTNKDHHSRDGSCPKHTQESPYQKQVIIIKSKVHFVIKSTTLPAHPWLS